MYARKSDGGVRRSHRHAGKRQFGVPLHVVTECNPGVEPAQQGANVFVSSIVQESRHPGAGGLVWSGTIHDDRPAGWDLAKTLVELAGGNMNGSRDFDAIRQEAEIGAQVDNHDAFATVKQGFELGGRNP